jgi:hypothetical protein
VGQHARTEYLAFGVHAQHDLDCAGIARAGCLESHAGHLAFLGGEIGDDFAALIVFQRESIGGKIVVVNAVRDHLRERILPVFHSA